MTTWEKWDAVREKLGDKEFLLHIQNFFSNDRLEEMLDDAIDQYDLQYHYSEIFGSMYDDDEDDE